MNTPLKWILSILFVIYFTNCSTPKVPDPLVVQNEIKVATDSLWAAMKNGSVDSYMNHFTSDAHILGTDPKEDWSKDAFTQYFKDAISAGFKGDHEISNSLILVSPDAKNAVANYTIHFPSLLKNGDVRFSYNWVQTQAGWKCNFLNISVTPPNTKVAAIDSILGVKN